jgi:hypothetical protein
VRSAEKDDIKGSNLEEYLSCKMGHRVAGYKFTEALLPACLPNLLFDRSWRWRQFAPPKCRWTSGLHGLTSRKIVFFLFKAERMSNPKYEPCRICTLVDFVVVLGSDNTVTHLAWLHNYENIPNENNLWRSRDNAVGIATGCGLDGREVGVWFPILAGFFSSPRRPDRLCGPPSLLFNGYRGFFPGGKAAEA